MMRQIPDSTLAVLCRHLPRLLAGASIDFADSRLRESARQLSRIIPKLEKYNRKNPTK